MRIEGRWKLPDADTYFAGKLTEQGFEIVKLAAALKHVKEFRVAVDGGAHIGTWTRYLAGRFSRVLAFEPAEDTVMCLVENAGEIPHVEIYASALGQEDLLCGVRDDPTRPGNTGARHLNFDVNQVEGHGVELVRLDDFHLPSLDFLKLDLEGYEYYALLGAEKVVRRCRPVVMIEEKDFGGRYGLKRGTASGLLKAWGAREVERMSNDVVFTFGE